MTLIPSGMLIRRVFTLFALLLAFAAVGRSANAGGLIELSAATGGAVAWAPSASPKIAFVSPVAAAGFDVGWHLASLAIGVDSAPLIKGEVTCLYDTFDDPSLHEEDDTPCSYDRHGPFIGGYGNDHFIQLTVGPMFGARRVRAGPFVAGGPHWLEVGLRSTVVLQTTSRRAFSLEGRTALLGGGATEAMLLARWSWNFAPERDTP